MPSPAVASSRAAASPARPRARRRRARRRCARDHQTRLLVAAGAERRVGGLDQLAQRRRRTRRRGRSRPGPRRGPSLERVLVGRVREPLGGALLEHLEARVQPGGQRLGAQQPRAEAVDRADPGAVDGPCVLVLAELGQPPPQPLRELAGRLLRERQGEDRADRDVVLAHGGGDPLDHHRGLARAGVGRQQRRAAPGGDRGTLLGREPHERQIPGWAQPPLYAQRSGHGRMRPARRSVAAWAATARDASSVASKVP